MSGEEAALTAEGQGGERECGSFSGTAELLHRATLHTLYIHLFFPLLRCFDFDLTSHHYEQRLKCKAELNSVICNEKLTDGYLLEMKVETFYNISSKNMILLLKASSCLLPPE